jgi:biopolymer transport protein ExbD
MASGAGSIESGEPEFQVAPMIDVLLVLLIFFMSITSAQVEQLDKEVQLPVAPDAKDHKPDPAQRTVNVRYKDGRAILTYKGLEYDDREKLVEILKEEAVKLTPPGSNATRLVVHIRADKRTPARDVQAAMQVVSQVTAKITFVAFNK